MNWPDVVPPLDPPPATGPRLIPGARGAASALPASLPQESVLDVQATPTHIEPHPVSGPALLTPLASVERSTKRRKFFSWPMWRGDVNAPLMLPQADETSSCFPAITSARQPCRRKHTRSRRRKPNRQSSCPTTPAKPPESVIPRLLPASLPPTVPLPQILEGSPLRRRKMRLLPTVDNTQKRDFSASATIETRLPAAIPQATPNSGAYRHDAARPHGHSGDGARFAVADARKGELDLYPASFKRSAHRNLPVQRSRRPWSFAPVSNLADCRHLSPASSQRRAGR